MDELLNKFKNENLRELITNNSDASSKIIDLYNIIGEFIFEIDENKLINIIDNSNRFYLVKQIIEETKKLNILENVNCNEDFLDYIYPNLKRDYSLSLLEYNTNATTNLVSLIKNGQLEKVNKILELFENNLEFNSRNIHIIFSNYYSCENILNQLISINITSDKFKIIKNNLVESLINNNLYKIDTIIDLIPKNYKEKENSYLDNISHNSDSSKMREEVCNFLISKLEKFSEGNPINEMKYYLKFYKLNEICEDIRNIAIEHIRNSSQYSFDKENIENKLNECMFTNDERMFIVIIQNIINYKDEDVIRLLIDEMKNISNISSKFKNIIEKTRKLFNLEMNIKLSSDLKSLEADRSVSDNGIEVIEPTGEFNFLCHTLYGYDDEHKSYVDMIIEDPSKWEKLDGASTLSTSSISEKNISILGKDEFKNNHVTFLFNNTPDDFLLFMDRKDLSIEHGNNNYNPNFGSAFFTTIDGLNHLTNKDGYNEVAGWRKNMRPCAIALMEDEPTEEQIKAAQYFNIPLVKLKKHIKSEQYAYLDTFEEYTKNLDSKTLSNFIFDNISESDNLMEKYRSRIDNVISFLLNSLKYTINISRVDEMDFLHRAILEQNKENYIELSPEDVIKQLNELEKLTCQIYDGEIKDLYMKVISLRYALSKSLNLTDDEILSIERSSKNPHGIYFQRNNEKYSVSTEIENYEFKTSTKGM